MPAAGDRGPAAGRAGLPGALHGRGRCLGAPRRFGSAWPPSNVGEGAIESIVAAREGRGEISDVAGPFASLDDLCRRVDLRTVNKRVLESLSRPARWPRSGRRGRCWRGWTRRWSPGRGTSATWPRGRGPSSTCSRHRARSHAVTRARRRRGRDPAQGAAALGEGAAGAVPLGASSRGHRRPAARLRDRLHRRPGGGERPGQGDAGRDHPVDPSRHHPRRLDHAGRDCRGPPGERRGGRLPEGLHGDRQRLGR